MANDHGIAANTATHRYAAVATPKSDVPSVRMCCLMCGARTGINGMLAL